MLVKSLPSDGGMIQETDSFYTGLMFTKDGICWACSYLATRDLPHGNELFEVSIYTARLKRVFFFFFSTSFPYITDRGQTLILESFFKSGSNDFLAFPT